MVGAPPHAGYRIVLVRDYIPSMSSPAAGVPPGCHLSRRLTRAGLRRAAAADPAHIRSVRESCLLTGLWIESRFEITEYALNRATDHWGF
jgi:hypothetical protein